MADIFDVVADSTRRDILAVLLERETAADGGADVSVSEIVAALGASQPTVSKHLKVLRENGLVAVREEGQHRYYRLDRGPLETIEDWLFPFTAADAATDAATLAGAGVPELESLKDEQRAIAVRIGKRFAETAHQMSAVVAPIKRR